MRRLLCALIVLTGLQAWAQGPEPTAAVEATTPSGEVRVPLARYERLVEDAREERAPAPAAFAFGVSAVTVRVDDEDQRTVARVEARLEVEILEDTWTLVPLLPAGTALASATANGRPLQLVHTADGIAWSTGKRGRTTLELRYEVPATHSLDGVVLGVPLPPAASTALEVHHPRAGLDFAVVPAARVTRVAAAPGTRFVASVPATRAVMITWRSVADRPLVVSRAHYDGHLAGDALAWRATFEVELLEGEARMPVVPNGVTLGGLRVDGEPATVLDEDGHFVTVLRGRGAHEVAVDFEVPVTSAGGPPGATVLIPRVPVSRFDLRLPGKKAITVSPQANVSTTESDEATHASLFVPMTDRVTFSWVDAIPEEVRTQVRAHASLYHAVHADEGVLHARGLVVYEISRGETSQLELSLPLDAQVSRIEAPAGGLSDWVESRGDDGRKTIDVFLDRAVSGEFVLDIAYELLLGREARDGAPIAVPLLSAVDVDRERGMVALLAGPELVLEPVSEARLSRVGENQLPALVRNRLDMAVAHTYKFTERLPELVVEAVTPERRQGKLDAQVDTLISIGEVTLRGSAAVTVNVKAGSIMALTLELPEDVNVLSVTGPSLRSREIREGNGIQAIDLEFTQEMEGQFRLEVSYERIMGESLAEMPVPAVSVAGAEVEHGRIGVEALTAVEVQPATAEQLSTLDVNDLPQQLVLKTTNPILLAYKYVQPPFRLALAIKRHREIDVQVAAIEAAEYDSLFTRDGLAVTTARFSVRNSRRQFLRLNLPPRSEVWSVFVDGKAEKPAYAGESELGDAVLIRMINSANGFPVEIVYATRSEPMGAVGALSARLPDPDMVVTRTRWDVFLPAGPSYGKLDSNLEVRVAGEVVSGRQFDRARPPVAADPARGGRGQALRIDVPAQGVRFGFQKLYANQADEAPGFTLHYASRDLGRVGLALSVLGAVALWVGVVALAGRRLGSPRAVAAWSWALGGGAIAGAAWFLGTDPTLAAVVAFAIGVALGVWRLTARLVTYVRDRRFGRVGD